MKLLGQKMKMKQTFFYTTLVLLTSALAHAAEGAHEESTNPEKSGRRLGSNIGEDV